MNTIEDWKSDLLDFSRYNRLLHFKEIKNKDWILSTYKIEEVLRTLSSGGSVKSDESLQNIYSRLIQKKEDDILYISIGLLNVNTKKNKHFSFPLLLYKVDLVKGEDNNFYLASDDNDVYFNPYFRTYIYKTYGIVIDEKVIISKDLSINKLFQTTLNSIQRSEEAREDTFVLDSSLCLVSTFSPRSGFSYADICFNEIDISSTEFSSLLLGENDHEVNKDNKHYKFRDEMLSFISPVSSPSPYLSEVMFALLRGQSLVLSAPLVRRDEIYKVNILSELLSENKTVLYLTNNKSKNRVIYNLLRDAKLDDNVFTFIKPSKNDSNKTRKKEIRKYLTKILMYQRTSGYLSTDYKKNSYENLIKQLTLMNELSLKKHFGDENFEKDEMQKKLKILLEEYYLCTKSRIHNNAVQNRNYTKLSLNKTDVEYLENVVVNDDFYNSIPLKLLLKKYIQIIKKAFPITIMSVDEVNRYLPSNIRYDALVIDNASSLSLLNAFPSLYRAKQIIAIGDDKVYVEENKISAIKNHSNLPSQFINLKSTFDVLKDYIPLYTLSDVYHGSSVSNLANKVIYDSSLTVMPAIFQVSISSGSSVFLVNTNVINNKRQLLDKGADELIKLVQNTIKYYPNDSLGIVTFDDEECVNVQKVVVDRFSNDDLFKEFCSKQSSKKSFYIRTSDTIGELERDTIILSAVLLNRLSTNESEKLIASILNMAKKRLLIIVPSSISKTKSEYSGVNKLKELVEEILRSKKDENTEYTSELRDELKTIQTYLKEKDYVLYSPYGYDSASSFDIAITNKEDRHISIGINFDEHNRVIEKSLYEKEYYNKYITEKNGWYYDTIKIDELKNNRLQFFATLYNIIQKAENNYNELEKEKKENEKFKNAPFNVYTPAPIDNTFTLEHQLSLIIREESPVNASWLFERLYKTYYPKTREKKAKKQFNETLNNVLASNQSFYKQYDFLYDKARKIEYRLNNPNICIRPYQYVSDEELLFLIKKLYYKVYKDLPKRERKNTTLKEAENMLFNKSTTDIKFVKKLKKTIKTVTKNGV